MATKDEVSLEESFEREECSEDIEDTDKDTQDTDKDTKDIDKDTQDQDNIGLIFQTETPDQNSNQPNEEEKGKVMTIQDLNIQENQDDSVETLKLMSSMAWVKSCSSEN